MKIYREVRINIDTGETLYEDVYEYTGPVAECKGGGGANMVDHEYNMGMLNISQAQQGMAEEYFDFWRNEYKPLEEAQIDANKELVTPMKEAQLRNIAFEADQQGFEREKWDVAKAGFGLQKQQIAAAERLLPQQEKVMSTFYERALEGVDERGAVQAAQADAAQASAIAESSTRRDAARMGLNVANMGTRLTQSTADRAKLALGATQTAKQSVEATNFQRLANAAGSSLGVGGA